MKLPLASQLTKEIERLANNMSDPSLRGQAGQIKELARLQAEKQALLNIVQRLTHLAQEEEEINMIFASPEDQELVNLAHEDRARLTVEKTALLSQAESILIPKDPRDSRDIILEIRAGAGGEEAALFALELFRAYSRYAGARGWNVHIVNQSLSEQGGYKEVVAEISGDGVFGLMKFERGVQRVQRVPATEKMGRIHTSTITVAVLPQAEEVDLVIKPEELRIDTYRAGGAGGQHVNKTSSAIRITHLPTSTVVAVQDERSQHKNKEKAMKILRSRLLEAHEEARHKKEAAERKSQVGTGDRSEKIRTYNFPQDRITDHRIKQSWSNIPGIMEGALDPILAALGQADREIKQSALGEESK